MMSHTYMYMYMYTLQARAWKLSEANEELPELKKQLNSLQEERGELQTRLKEMEQSSQQEREDHEAAVAEMRQSHEETTSVGIWTAYLMSVFSPSRI